MKTFMVQASLTIVNYDHKNMFIVQATDQACEKATMQIIVGRA